MTDGVALSLQLHRRWSGAETRSIATLCVSLILVSCGGDGRGEIPPPPPPPPPPSYSVGFTVTGLVGSGLQLKNGADTLNVATNGEATFSIKLPTGSAYAVSVL